MNKTEILHYLRTNSSKALLRMLDKAVAEFNAAVNPKSIYRGFAGGAVLTKKYADMLNAGRYIKNTMESVRVAKVFFNEEENTRKNFYQ